jgi:hypothetical protein
MDSEYDRLRTADNAGIKHKMWMNNLKFQKETQDARQALWKESNDLSKESNSIKWGQVEDAKTGALIGGLMGVGGIAYNVAEQEGIQKRNNIISNNNRMTQELLRESIRENNKYRLLNDISNVGIRKGIY